MSRRERLRVAIVGAGLMGRWHGKAALQSRGRVVAVMDRDAAGAKALAAALKAPAAGTDLSELLANAAPDVVHICTPLETHYPLAMASLEAGCHVLVEKPVTRSHPEASALLDRAREGGTLLCPTHQFLFQPGVLRLRALQHSLGSLRHLQLTACSAGADGGDDRRRDHVAVEILPHFLSLVARLAPEPFKEFEWTLLRPGAGELRLVGCGGGTTAAALVSMSGRPTRNELEWIGSEGSAHLDLYHGFVTFEKGGPSRREKLVRPFRLGSRTLLAAGGQLAARTLRWEPAYPGLRELVGRFYHAVRSGGPPPIAEDEVLGVSRAWEPLRREVAAFTGGAT